MKFHLFFLLPVLTAALVLNTTIGAAAENSPAGRNGAEERHVYVVVNGKPITENDLELMMLSRRVPEKFREKLKQRFLEQLVERQLIQGYLNQRKIEAPQELLENQVARVREIIRKTGEDPKQVLSRLGYDEERLRKELALPLAWRHYVSLIVTQDRLRTYFDKHRAQFDGTEVRASQILLKVSKGADEKEFQAVEEKLKKIRAEIVKGKISFSEAAREYSEAPSAEEGGDVGFFAYRGTMPEVFSRIAFGLDVGEVSRPFRSPFGVHLVTVTDHHPGQFSLEDVRQQVLDQFSREFWDEVVEKQREKATIEWSAQSR